MLHWIIQIFEWNLPPRSYTTFFKTQKLFEIGSLSFPKFSLPLFAFALFSSLLLMKAFVLCIFVCECVCMCIFKVDCCAVVLEIGRLTLQGTCGIELLPFYPEQINFGLSMFTWKRNLETLQVMFGLCII